MSRIKSRGILSCLFSPTAFVSCHHSSFYRKMEKKYSMKNIFLNSEEHITSIVIDEITQTKVVSSNSRPINKLQFPFVYQPVSASDCSRCSRKMRRISCYLCFHKYEILAGDQVGYIFFSLILLAVWILISFFHA